LATKDVLIIGGGISGITVALELAQTGIRSTVIEREHSLGGLSASFCCKASDSCNKCFACVVDKRISDVQRSREVSILTETELIGLNGKPGEYRASLRRGRNKIDLDAGAVVIAVGIEPYDASEKGEYGYGRYKNVITAKDLDEMLRFRGVLSRPSDNRLPKNVAFFQCVGSRDESIGKLYCSQVCCAYALRLIKAIRYKYPDVVTTFLYMDIQPAGASFQPFLESCREDKGIRFIRSLPSKVYPSALSDNLRVRFIDPEKDDVVEETFDLIVLSVGLTLRRDAKGLADLFNLGFTEDGFFTTSSPARAGVFVAGACSGPKDVERSIAHAKWTALRVHHYLRDGS
jgi:heterodisulfide reductase subunit A